MDLSRIRLQIVMILMKWLSLKSSYKGMQKMPTYNKLVRDKIPEIIEKNGKTCTIMELDMETYIKELKNKFVEELHEYLEATSDDEAIEELSDVLEIIHSLSKIHGKSIEDVEKMRKKKFKDRGGFHDKLYLVEVKDK